MRLKEKLKFVLKTQVCLTYLAYFIYNLLLKGNRKIFTKENNHMF